MSNNGFDNDLTIRFLGINYDYPSELYAAVGIEKDSIGFDKTDVFENFNVSVLKDTVTRQYFTIKENSPTRFKAEILHNINDGFIGTAPDLGCYEYGKPLPHYGSRFNN